MGCPGVGELMEGAELTIGKFKGVEDTRRVFFSVRLGLVK